MKKPAKLHPAQNGNPGLQEMESLVMENMDSNNNDLKPYEKIDPSVLSSFARREGLSFVNGLILGGTRMG